MAPTPPSRWRKWGERAMVVSDWAGKHANAVGGKFGVERFWPTSGDYVQELEKCERILRMFTVEGVPTEETSSDGKKKRKVFRKLPPNIVKEARGLIIFTAMRSGIAPFAGAGGGGIIITRMQDGAWSPPSFISPNNFSAGLMLGLDVYNAILVLRTEEAVKGFRTHNLTLGSDLGIAAGPLGGAGISGEMGLKKGSVHKTPIFSYVQSKGFYAGVSLVGQAFLDRFDENERVYHWQDIKAGDIFDGKVRRPPESKSFYIALQDAETGAAQGANLEWDTDEVKDLELESGEVLRLPPTPEQLSEWEAQGIKDEDDIKLDEEERKAVRALPPPPLHPRSRQSRSRPSSSASSIRNGAMSGSSTPELQGGAFQSHPGSPLAAAPFASSHDGFLSPPPPPPRRHPDHYLTSTSEAVPESPSTDVKDSSTYTSNVDALGIQTMSLVDKRSSLDGNAESSTAGNPASDRPETPPPAFDIAVTGEASSPLPEKSVPSEEIAEAPETLLVPPPLPHQDSESDVSIYSEATDHTEAGGKEVPEVVDEMSTHQQQEQTQGSHNKLS